MIKSQMRPILFKLTILSVLLSLNPLSGCSKPPNKKKIVKGLAEAYYSLKSHGLLGFQATVQPDFRMALEPFAADSARFNSALKILDGIHFTISLDSDDNITIAHEPDLPMSDKMSAYSSIVQGSEKTLFGLFSVWKPLVLLGNPLSDGMPLSDTEVKEHGNEYVVSQKNRDETVVLTLAKDYAIQKTVVNTSEGKVEVTPQFTKSPQGFLLTGFSENVDMVSPSMTVKLDAKVEYQEIDGLQLPRLISVNGTYGQTIIKQQWTFSDYKLKTKSAP